MSAVSTLAPKILVLGAGVSGLAFAAAAARFGLQVKVFEKLPEFSPPNAGATMWWSALHALEGIHLLDQVLAKTVTAPSTISIIDSTNTSTILPARANAWHSPWGAQPPLQTAIHLRDLQEVFIKCAGTRSIHYGRSVILVDQDSERVRLQFEDGSIEEGDVLVAADGLDSFVRTLLYPPPPVQYRMSASRCWQGMLTQPGRISFEQLRTGYLQFKGVDLQFSIYPLNRSHVYWTAKARKSSWSSSGSSDNLTTMFQHFPAQVTELLSLTPAADIHEVKCCDFEPLKSWNQGRITFTGDSVHPTMLFPDISLAIESSVVLAYLLSEFPLKVALDTYWSTRRGRTANVNRLAYAQDHKRDWKVFTAFGELLRQKTIAYTALRKASAYDPWSAVGFHGSARPAVKVTQPDKLPPGWQW
eukprot:GILJ01011460.1.p1 GENE.GILJ01011460.1~~GILJ01011460.1.p1  ORF type:complete len:416 (+),score=36.22 GILJ01011460.1:26-1273(+)